MDSDDYMKMINNPVINPPRSQNNDNHADEATTTTTTKLPLEPAFAKVAKASVKLQAASQDLYLESETDAPFEWVNSDWSKPTPPETEQELVECGFLDESEQDGSAFSTESLEEFFETLPDTHQRIREAFDTISNPGSSKVYRIGDTSITVLVLAVVEDTENPGVYSLVGLKSLLVMT